VRDTEQSSEKDERGGVGVTASGADLVKPGGSGTVGEEEEASGSSTAQRRARPFPFSIAGGPMLGDRRPGAPPLAFLRPAASGLETGTSASPSCRFAASRLQLVGLWGREFYE